MRNSHFPVSIILFLLLAVAGRPLHAQGIIISEFQALNRTTLMDEDREFSDWVELFNSGDTTVNLRGFYLTDDPRQPTQWRLPAVEMPPKTFLLVFCSRKSRADPAQPLHANFRLAREGEYLGLVNPDGATVAWQFAPTYPEQVLDASHGYRHEFQQATILTAGAPGRVFIPVDSSLGLAWTEAAFDDSGWTQGNSGFGYDQKSTPSYSEFIQTDVGDAMRNVNSTAYIRIPFQVDNPAAVDLLLLRLRFEDGFIAYLNGVEVTNMNAPGIPEWNSRATRSYATNLAREFTDFDISKSKTQLRAGINILAIHGLNDAVTSTDFFVLPELMAVSLGAIQTTKPEYFEKPSPGWPNGTGFPGVSKEPFLSLPAGAYPGQISLEMSSDTPGAEIRYTTNLTEPNRESPLYQGPIAINSITTVKARLFEPGLLPSRSVSQTYVMLNPSVVNFNSNLPLFVVNTFGGSPNAGSFTRAHFMAIDRSVDGRTRLTDVPDFMGSGHIKVRGSSTAGIAKPSYALEVQDEQGDDLDVSILGFPRESDWILHGPYSFDPALMRNSFIFRLSNQIGRYATRDRFVELYLNSSPAAVSSPHYAGVYVFQEKIKRGPDRVNIEELRPEQNTEPEITGGYMLKIDRLDPGDSGFQAAGQRIAWVDPKERERTPAQQSWIQAHFESFARALNGPNFADPDLGYAQFIDIDSWIDHHLLNVLTKNVDALRLSTYFFKDRGKKIEFGPIWDFDRSMNSTDGRDDDPRTWNGTGDGTTYFTYPWWGRLFQDANFMARYQARWRELRKDKVSTQNMHAIINDMQQELNEAQVRNFQRWGNLGRGGWVNEVNLLRNWLADRAAWMDGQFVPIPIFSHRGGQITPPLELTMTIDGNDSTIYYTLDGSDPRLPNLTPAPSAQVYRGPITITENTRVRARGRVGTNVWSEPQEAIFIASIPTIAISELMYNPEGGTAFEFVEIFNFGDKPVRLRGSAFTRGVLFSFSDTAPESLDPGEYMVIVQDQAAFSSRYDTSGIRIAGQYLGSLSDRSEFVSMTGPITEQLFEFIYRDDWYPETDGGGRSLVLVDPSSPSSGWGEAASWRPSTLPGGSPGKEDPAEIPTGGQIPGDISQDGTFSITDPINLLRYLFGGAIPRLPCAGGAPTDAANLVLLDSTGDGVIDASDAVHALVYLFLDGPEPAGGKGCVQIQLCPEVCAQP